MAVFRKEGGRTAGTINTGSTSDIVFMLLFFFMVTTTFKTATLKVHIAVPGATEVKKLEDKSLVSYIFIGTPLNVKMFGTEPRVQLNDSFKEINDIRDFIAAERQMLSEADQKKMTVSLKIDRTVKMGTVTDVKLALRKASALKINYSARFDDSYLR
jgi:biopolymer transport protein ExbD